MSYNDFIPEGERKGGLGSGFSDFVPESEQVVLPESIKREPNETDPIADTTPSNEIDEALNNPVVQDNTLNGIKGIGKASVEKLKKINITTPEQLVQMSDEQLASIVGKLNVKKMKKACMEIIASA